MDNKSHILLKILGMLCVTAIVIVSIVLALEKDEPVHEFNVSATGEVTAIPDVAVLTIGVYTDAKDSATQAVTENTKKMNEIITALGEADIEDKDIQTTSYNLKPVYDWTEKEGRKLRGYEVRQNASIKIRDLEKIGKAIQVTTQKGANQIGNINFTIDDPEELKREALERAIVKAKSKAEDLANKSGLKLGDLVNLYEAYAMPEGINRQIYAEKTLGLGGGDMPEPTIKAGEQKVRAEVNLIYEIK